MEQPLYNEYAAQLADQQYRQLNAQYETEVGGGGPLICPWQFSTILQASVCVQFLTLFLRSKIVKIIDYL